MVITYHGGGYLKLQSGDDVILIDPSNQRSVRGAAAVIFTTHPNEIADEASREGDVPVFTHQGEYEVKGIRIDASTAEQNSSLETSAYRIQWDGITIGILGPVSGEPDAKTILPLQGSDILILPAGGASSLNPATAAKIVRQVEPSVTIPSFVEKGAGAFLKELGGSPETLERLTVKKKDLPEHAMKTVVLGTQ